MATSLLSSDQPQIREKMNTAASPIPCRGPHSGGKSIWLHDRCFLGGPHSGEKSLWLHDPCILRVPIVGRNPYGYISPVSLGSP